ncbi:CPBP family glutamic-type intramembrane protease [Paenibacillus barengoltzii]|uniref:CPBP family glutamic-type intramembrane protease n=1 Tax=Paenibacillus barengoltzii TaxID=343517 RepID=UPI00398A7EA8
MLGRLRDSDPQPAKSGKNAPKLTWKPIIRESSPSQPSQQPETIFENRLFQEQLDSLVFGIIYYQTRNVWVSWLAHFAANLLAYFYIANGLFF